MQIKSFVIALIGAFLLGAPAVGATVGGTFERVGTVTSLSEGPAERSFAARSIRLDLDLVFPEPGLFGAAGPGGIMAYYRTENDDGASTVGIDDGSRSVIDFATVQVTGDPSGGTAYALVAGFDGTAVVRALFSNPVGSPVDYRATLQSHGTFAETATGTIVPSAFSDFTITFSGVGGTRLSAAGTFGDVVVTPVPAAGFLLLGAFGLAFAFGRVRT